MPTRRQLIQKIELNSIASSVTFSNVPQNYTDLELEFSVRGDTNVSSQITTDAYIQFNGSTSGYSRRSIYADFPSTVGSTSGSNIRGQINLPVSTSNTFASNKAYIPNYNGSQNKTVSVLSMSETNSATGPRIESVAGLWSSSSAISSIKFTPYTGSFVANSTFYLYGITHVPIIRGGEVSIRDGFKYHTFRSTSTLQVVEPGDVDVLIVAGGAGGGVAGGGAGGTRLVKTRLQKNPQNYAITIGSGGAADTSGNNTTIASGGTTYLSATGGGRAAAYENGDPGSSGGSGGGGRYNSAAGSGNAGGYTPPEGYSGAGSNSTQSGGGGGGASASGSAGSSSTGGNGGAGLLAFGTYYGGGGGGGGASTGGAGGIGGGGGGAGGSVINGGRSAGLPNTGGGSGGNWTASSTFTGGSGIVVIRYPYDGN